MELSYSLNLSTFVRYFGHIRLIRSFYQSLMFIFSPYVTPYS